MLALDGRKEIDHQLLDRMNQSQFHRGPVEGDLYIESGLGFGHRRLSIIDLAAGKQPLFNEDRSIVVVFNGEIYNFQSLMKELIELGHHFATRCDTEVIVHAWEQWGEQCLSRFRGMFAFALWDRNQETLLIARDRLGIKPLFYSVTKDGMLVFGSELKSLLCVPQLNTVLDPNAVEDYFAYGYIPDPKTIFRDVHKLAPGHSLLIHSKSKHFHQKKYWDLHFKLHEKMSEVETEESLIFHLKDSVASHMIADVPLGGFLSGGVDSSAVVAMMAEFSATPVNTCSISFAESAFDESPFALKVARQYGTNHFSEQVNNQDFDLIDTLSGLYDEPYADSSAIPTYRVCQLARKKVTVALSGDGGDENFAGYRRYRHSMVMHRFRSIFPSGLRQPLFGFLGEIYPKADWAPQLFRAKTSFQAMACDLTDSYFQAVSIISDQIRQKIFSQPFRNQLAGYQAVDVLRQHARHAPTEDALSILQYLDMKTYLPGDILTKVDRASMAHALEVRVPLLDHQFVEWAAGVPSSMKLHSGEGKYIFKRSLEKYLPNDILYRPKKGFSIPLAMWMRGPLRERMRQALLGNVLADSGMFDMKYIETMIDRHLSGRSDFGSALWALLMFEAFLRNVSLKGNRIFS